MRAVAFAQHGGVDVLASHVIAQPEPGAGEVLIEVAFAGVNPADWKIREGWLASFLSCPPPFVPGFDMAGTIAALGSGVTDLAIGQRVVAVSNQGMGQNGSYAQLAIAAAERTVPLPDNLSFEFAASLPTAGMTAIAATLDQGLALDGACVLVNGGAGGTGSFAIQLLKHAGARVAATCGAHNAKYVALLGAELTIDYTAPDAAAQMRAFAPDGYTLVLDTVGQGSLPHAPELLAAHGRYVAIETMIANEPLPAFAPDDARAVRVMSLFPDQPRHLRELVARAADGRLKPPSLTILPLEDAGKAQQLSAAGHVRGKLLLRI